MCHALAYVQGQGPGWMGTGCCGAADGTAAAATPLCAGRSLPHQATPAGRLAWTRPAACTNQNRHNHSEWGCKCVNPAGGGGGGRNEVCQACVAVCNLQSAHQDHCHAQLQTAALHTAYAWCKYNLYVWVMEEPVTSPLGHPQTAHQSSWGPQARTSLLWCTPSNRRLCKHMQYAGITSRAVLSGSGCCMHSTCLSHLVLPENGASLDCCSTLEHNQAL